MDSKNPAFNKDEKLLRRIYDIINESKECKKNSLKTYHIQKKDYENIKKLFTHKNQYKKKARDLIYKFQFNYKLQN